MTVTCLHCSGEARLTDGREIYPHRLDLHHKPFWKCDPCDATCGCHPGTTEALGHPANKETRTARSRLHEELLDPLWKSAHRDDRRARRNRIYHYLSEKMSLPREKTHTGMFTIEQCREAWRVLKEFRP